jgi:hypothetical protein
MKTCIFSRTCAGDGRLRQRDSPFHSTSITGGSAPATFGTLRMNQSACWLAGRHQ